MNVIVAALIIQCWFFLRQRQRAHIKLEHLDLAHFFVWLHDFFT